MYVELANPDGRFIGGQYARGSIATGATQAIVLPASAVQGLSQDGRTGHVCVVANGRVSCQARVARGMFSLRDLRPSATFALNDVDLLGALTARGYLAAMRNSADR
ncbi:MAG: hypothetical protein ACYC1S_12935 [Gemmatimonadaceae bacterium]